MITQNTINFEAPPPNISRMADKENQEPVENAMTEAQTLEVAKWDPDRNGRLQSELPEVDMWLVDCTTEKELTGKRKKIWARGGLGSPAFRELHENLGIEPDETATNTGGGFVKGQAFMGTTTLRTASGANRPKVVFRVTHEGTSDGRIKPMPFGGLKARGYGTVKTDPIHFQDHVQLHLNWNWRGKSPFISVAERTDLVLLFCEIYIHKRCQGIKIHRIKTTGEAWNHEEQRMFSVEHLAKKLDLRMREAYEDEYLIENEIPTACIVETIDPCDFPMSWVTRMRDFSLVFHPRRERQKIEKLERLQIRIEKMRAMASELQRELAQEQAKMSSQKGNDENKLVGEERDRSPNTDENFDDAMEEEEPKGQESEDVEMPEDKGQNEVDATMLEYAAKDGDATKPSQDSKTSDDTDPSELSRSLGDKESPQGTKATSTMDPLDAMDLSEDEDNDKDTKNKAPRIRSKGFQRVNWKEAA